MLLPGGERSFGLDGWPGMGWVTCRLKDCKTWGRAMVESIPRIGII